LKVGFYYITLLTVKEYVGHQLNLISND